MHTTATKHIRVHHNSDWSGTAVVQFFARADGGPVEVDIDAEELVQLAKMIVALSEETPGHEVRLDHPDGEEAIKALDHIGLQARREGRDPFDEASVDAETFRRSSRSTLSRSATFSTGHRSTTPERSAWSYFEFSARSSSRRTRALRRERWCFDDPRP